MKQLLIIGTILLIGAFSNAPKGTVKVYINNINSSKGKINIALYDETGKAHFVYEVNKAYKVAYGKVTGKRAVAVFKNIPYGKYAISLFHDINADNTLNCSKKGFPIEPYGFSNNPAGFGIPSFDKSSFELLSSSLKIEIDLREIKIKNKR